MDIIISGYGRMGKEVEKICLHRNHKIIAKIDNEKDWHALSNSELKNTVVIDFSTPEVALANFTNCFKLGIPVVTGTTGWYNNFEKVVNECNTLSGSFFYATNFSIGVNFFFIVNTYLAELMSKFTNYNVSINETHHIHKLDAPSGTAITIAEGITNEYNNLNSWTLDKNYSANQLPITSIRKGEITGIHVVNYESNEDIISISHEAKNRSGFALGAVLAAEFMVGKIGVYNMDELLKNI